MTIAQAKLRNLRIAPRKVRLAIGFLRGLGTNEALAQLQTGKVRSVGPLTKLIKSAIANAKNKNLDTSKLIIQSITVDGGAMYKRQLPRARGRATPLHKKMSHVTLILAESNKVLPGKYNLYEVKKKRSEKTEKAVTQKPKFKEAKKLEAKERSGILQRIFRRKAI